MQSILAPEILAHLTVARELRAGDLVVFTDYAGRTMGARITRMWVAGEITREAQSEIYIIDGAARGCKFVVETSKLVGAL